MNIREPETSRQLAILIQPVIADDRRKFREAAEKAKDMEAFIKTLTNYRTF